MSDRHTTAGVDGVLPIGAATSGRVTAASDGTPLANVDVSGIATTAADGAYRIIGLPGGTTLTVCFSRGTGGPSAGGYVAACYHTGVGTAGAMTEHIDAVLGP